MRSGPAHAVRVLTPVPGMSARAVACDSCVRVPDGASSDAEPPPKRERAAVRKWWDDDPEAKFALQQREF